MCGSTAPNRSHANIPRTGRERFKRPVSRPSRPALRGGVTGGEPPFYPAQKSNLCPAPKTGQKSDGRFRSHSHWGRRRGRKPHPVNTAPHGLNAAFQGAGGVQLPPSPQGGHKRPYNAKQGPSRFLVAPDREKGGLLALNNHWIFLALLNWFSPSCRHFPCVGGF